MLCAHDTGLFVGCPNLLGDRWASFGIDGGQGHGTNTQHETRPSTQTTSHHLSIETKVKLKNYH